MQVGIASELYDSIWPLFPEQIGASLGNTVAEHFPPVAEHVQGLEEQDSA
jgi:hypothetical protein